MKIRRVEQSPYLLVDSIESKWVAQSNINLDDPITQSKLNHFHQECLEDTFKLHQTYPSVDSQQPDVKVDIIKPKSDLKNYMVSSLISQPQKLNINEFPCGPVSQLEYVTKEKEKIDLLKSFENAPSPQNRKFSKE